MPELDADVGEYYNRGGEATRLDETLELLRTKVLLDRLLPKPPASTPCCCSRLIARTEREPAIVGAIAHLLAAGR